MSAQPSGEPPYEVISLGGEKAAIVPLDQLRRLRAIARHASPEAVEQAELEEAEEFLARYREWDAAGRPGAMTHEEAMAHLLTGGS